jgi:plastocyanin
VTARALAGIAALALAAGLPSTAAPAVARAPAAKPAKQVKRLCPARARCAVLRRHRRPLAGRPLERLLGVGPGPSTEPAPAPGQPGTPTPDAPALPRSVSVAAREYSLTPSRPLVGAGAVTVELRNSGEDPHNLVVSPEGTHTALASFSEIGPGTYERRSVTLAPGRYQLWCSLEAHETLGMSTTLTVQ